MKNQERRNKIKKILIILLLSILSIDIVKGEEIEKEYPDVTNDIEIRYKWYKEIIKDGDYYPLKNIAENDKIDKNNIKYVKYNFYNEQNCSLPSEYYKVEGKEIKEYKKVDNVQYVLVENITTSDQIKIYYNNALINVDVISVEEDKIKIRLKREYQCDTLLFFVNTDKKYKISLYRDSNFEKIIVSKEIENEKISIPDKTWIIEETIFSSYITPVELKESDLTKLIWKRLECKYSEKYVYKYNVTKEYYDENYHLNIDGYKKDEKNYKFFYKGEPITITNTVEVPKEIIVKEPQTEYVYIEKTKDKEKNDSSQIDKCIPETKIETKVKTEVVEKEVFKIPKKMYIVIFLLIIVIITLIVKLFRKNVD